VSGRDDDDRLRPGLPPAGGDILEMGSDRMRVLRWRPPASWWRPPRVAVVLGAAGLLAGLAVGYAVGIHHAARSGQPSRLPAAAQAAPSPLPAADSVNQSGPQCSAQVGPELQLGIEVTNVSATAITLRRVEVVLPMGGLKPASQAWGPCSELPPAALLQGTTLPAGASAWFTVTFHVLVRCPQPLPVQFRLDYDVRGRPAATSLPGFDDLGQVAYTGCQRPGA
jgi:hypothetical protein